MIIERELFSEINPMYASVKGAPNTIRARIRVRGDVDPDILRVAADTAMKRYPYYCVELKKKDGEYVFVPNERPIVVTDSLKGVTLNSEGSNYHMIAFGWSGDEIIADTFHALTDGTGLYNVLRTLLYYYCAARYGVSISSEGIRLDGDDIPEEEWEDPAAKLPPVPEPEGGDPIPGGLNLQNAAGISGDRNGMVNCVTIDESEFLKFNTENDGSPATMAALLVSRAVASVCPDCPDPIRISVCVNQRKALKAPLAHQSLVGGAWLEYKDRMRSWPLEMQATAYRGMVFAQTTDESVFGGLNAINRNTRRVLARETDVERAAVTKEIGDGLRNLLTATVSYVGKANFNEAERFISEFHLFANAMFEGMLIEISAVNGRFTFDFIQNFSDPVYFDAFLKQLDENGIKYERKESGKLELPDIDLPWKR